MMANHRVGGRSPWLIAVGRSAVMLAVAAAATSCSVDPVEACSVIPADALEAYFPEGVTAVRYAEAGLGDAGSSCSWGGDSVGVIQSSDLTIQWDQDNGASYENDRSHWCGRVLPLPCSHTDLENGFVRYDPNGEGAEILFKAGGRSYWLSSTRLDDEGIIALAERVGFVASRSASSKAVAAQALAPSMSPRHGRKYEASA